MQIRVKHCHAEPCAELVSVLFQHLPSQKDLTSNCLQLLNVCNLLLSKSMIENETIQLVGALSNDLFRVASLAQRGSNASAIRFMQEAQRWSDSLKNQDLPTYITQIVTDVSSREPTDISLESAERYLMYGIQLQNFALHTIRETNT